MEEKKNVTLETELLTDMQDNIKRILLEVESMEIDLGRAEFLLDELLDLTMNSPKYEAGKLVHDYPRIHSFLDLADDYVSKARSIATDLLIMANREENQAKSEAEPTEVTETRRKLQETQIKMLEPQKNYIKFNLGEYTDYVKTMSGHKQTDVTNYIRDLISVDMKANYDLYKKLKSMRED